jgi:hypothetical protein
MFGSVEAGQAVLALTGENAQTFAGDLDTIATSAGVAEEAFTQMEESTSRQMEHLQSSLKDVAISIGESLMPALQSIIDTLKPILETVGNWIARNPELIKTLMAAGAAILGAGGIVFALSKLIGVIRAVATGLAVLQGLSGPAGWAVLAGSAAVIGGAVYGINKLLGEGDEAGYSTSYDNSAMVRAQQQEINQQKQKERSQFLTETLNSYMATGLSYEEAFAKLSKEIGGSSGNITINVEGSVISEGELVETVREGLLEIQNSEGSTGLEG